jgi:SAM-dependent methyltransferase
MAIMVTRRMQEAYDAIAGAYADRYATMPDPLADLGFRFLERLPVHPTILDAGCGAGRDMAWFEANGASVIGIDLSLGMLAQARTRVEGALVQMDMTALAFPEHTFDGVWCMASLLHLPKASVPLALSELHRVLAPAGTLVLAVQEGDSEGWEVGIYPGVERFFARYEIDEIEDVVRTAGFTGVSVKRRPADSRIWLHLIANRGGR